MIKRATKFNLVIDLIGQLMLCLLLEVCQSTCDVIGYEDWKCHWWIDYLSGDLFICKISNAANLHFYYRQRFT